MRAAPVATVYAESSGTAGNIRQIGSGADKTATITLNSSAGYVANTAATTGVDAIGFYFTASSGL